jgi:hypothetical protein
MSIVKPLGGEIKPTGAGGDDLTLFSAISDLAADRCLKALEQDAHQRGEHIISFRLGQQ